MVKEMYTYKEALDKVEYVMRYSGIRQFCTEQCRGHCCGSCFTGEDACHKHEGRRLSCSLFVCHELQILARIPAARYGYIMDSIAHYTAPFYSRRYFAPPKKGFEKCRIPKALVDEFVQMLSHDHISRLMHQLRCLSNKTRESLVRDCCAAGLNEKIVNKVFYR